MNLNPSEVAKFDAMAPEWWDPEGACKALHQLNPVRLNFIQARIPIQKESQILDLGCGGGILTESLAQTGACVQGLDASEAAIQVARLHALESNSSATYTVGTAESFLNSHSQSFDLITCLELLEHVPDPSALLASCASLLKPGGHLILSTLNRNPKAFLQAIIGAEYVLKLLAKGTHQYASFIRPSELVSWARTAGFELNSMRGLSYQFFSQKFVLSEDVSVNYICDFIKTGSNS